MVIFVVISCFFRLSPASFPELVLTIHKKTQPCFEFLWQKYANIPWQQSESIQISPNQKKTRCSPRTRMQSRRTLLWTSYLNSLVHFPLLLYQCTVDCGMRKRVGCKVWSVKCRYGMWGGKCKLWSVECRVWNVECGVQNVDCKVWSVECAV